MKKPASTAVAEIGRIRPRRAKPEPVVVEDPIEAPIEDAKVENGVPEEPQVEDKTVLQALRVLKRLSEIHDEKKKKTLFTEAAPVILQIECIKIPECPTRKLRFKLPHSLATDASEICLFVADMRRGKRVDHEPTVQHYEDLLRKEGVTNIKTVMPVRQVRVEYDQMELRRQLLTQYDFFLADARISGLMAHKLGTTFQRKNQMPTPVRIHEGDIKKNIEKALHKTTMNLHSTGSTYAMKIAIGTHSEEEACQNVQAVFSQLVSQLPGGWENVRSVYLKNPLSMAIPVYVTLKNQNLVMRTHIKPLNSLKGFEEDELSTALNTTVKVFADGRVSVKRKRINSEEDEDKENAEHTSDSEAEENVETTEEIKDDNNEDDDVSERNAPKNKRKQKTTEAIEEDDEVSSIEDKRNAPKNKRQQKTTEAIEEDDEVSSIEDKSDIKEQPVVKKPKLIKSEKVQKSKPQKVKGGAKPKKKKT